MSTPEVQQFNVRFPADDNIREELKAVARAEDRSASSLLRCFIVEGLRGGLRTDRVAARV